MRHGVLRAEAELSALVATPTPHLPCACQPARVVRSRRDCREAGRPPHRRRFGMRDRGAVAELPPGVIAPAVRRPVRRQGAGVHAAGTDRGERQSTRHGHGYRTAGIVVPDLAVITGWERRVAAQLAGIVCTPAPGAKVGCDPARGCTPGGDRAERQPTRKRARLIQRKGGVGRVDIETPAVGRASAGERAPAAGPHAIERNTRRTDTHQRRGLHASRLGDHERRSGTHRADQPAADGHDARIGRRPGERRVDFPLAAEVYITLLGRRAGGQLYGVAHDKNPTGRSHVYGGDPRSAPRPSEVGPEREIASCQREYRERTERPCGQTHASSFGTAPQASIKRPESGRLTFRLGARSFERNPMPTFFERVRAALAPEGYQVEGDHELGSGGMGMVVRAWQVGLHRLVAVKVIRPEMHTAVAVARFQREAQTLAKLRNPHIVLVIASAETKDGLPYYVMEHLQGQTLADRLRTGPLPPEQALTLGRHLLDALAHAHAHDVIHRDVKPSNVFWDGENAVLVDFGIAQRLSSDGKSPDTPYTEPGWVPGTPDYMAPEQRAHGEATRASDQYAAALVIFEAFAGRHWVDALQSKASVWRGVPFFRRSVVARALHYNPEKRWPSVATFRHKLRAIWPWKQLL